MIRCNAPCRDCDKRHATCHNECEEYKEYKANSDRIRQEHSAYMRGTQDMAGYIGDLRRRINARRRER